MTWVAMTTLIWIPTTGLDDGGEDTGDTPGDDDVLRHALDVVVITAIGERKPKKGDKTTTKRSKGKDDVRGNRGKTWRTKSVMGRTTGDFAASSSVKNTLPERRILVLAD